MPVTITCRAKVATCTQGIFRYTFHVDPKPNSDFIQFLMDKKKGYHSYYRSVNLLQG